MVRTQTHKNNKDNCNKKNKTVSHLQPFLNRRFHPFFAVLILTFSPCKEDEDNRRLQPLFPNVLVTFASAFAFEDKNNNFRPTTKSTSPKFNHFRPKKTKTRKTKNKMKIRRHRITERELVTIDKEEKICEKQSKLNPTGVNIVLLHKNRITA